MSDKPALPPHLPGVWTGAAPDADALFAMAEAALATMPAVFLPHIQGVVIAIEEFFARGLDDCMAEARARAGDGATYVSYDIDFIDPAFAPGTGTPEIGGPNSFQALQVVRLLDGVNIVGADVVEVSPPFDQGAMTAFMGVTVMFELLCVMAAQAN